MFSKQRLAQAERPVGPATRSWRGQYLFPNSRSYSIPKTLSPTSWMQYSTLVTWSSSTIAPLTTPVQQVALKCECCQKRVFTVPLSQPAAFEAYFISQFTADTTRAEIESTETSHGKEVAGSQVCATVGKWMLPAGVHRWPIFLWNATDFWLV